MTIYNVPSIVDILGFITFAARVNILTEYFTGKKFKEKYLYMAVVACIIGVKARIQSTLFLQEMKLFHIQV